MFESVLKMAKEKARQHLVIPHIKNRSSQGTLSVTFVLWSIWVKELLPEIWIWQYYFVVLFSKGEKKYNIQEKKKSLKYIFTVTLLLFPITMLEYHNRNILRALFHWFRKYFFGTIYSHSTLPEFKELKILQTYRKWYKK